MEIGRGGGRGADDLKLAQKQNNLSYLNVKFQVLVRFKLTVET